MISLKRKSETVSVPKPATGTAKLANEVRTAHVPLEGGVYAASGVIRFGTMAEVKSYVAALLDVYKKEYERTTEAVASMYRTMGDKASSGSASGSWPKIGALYVNSVDTEKGMMEVALQVLTDLKPRLARTEEVVDGFNRVEDVPMSAASTVALYMRNGAPERLVVCPQATEDAFSFAGEFELV